MAAANAGSTLISAPISVGELIDKITILEIKAERISERAKLANVNNELSLLRAIETKARLHGETMAALASELKAVNSTLWEIEDEIRELEANADFGARFIELARAVYLNNDRRSRIKRAISEAAGSAIVEEKSYKGA